MNKLFAAALLILSGSTVFVSAQEATKDQDKARTPPKYYPTEFQISGSDSGARADSCWTRTRGYSTVTCKTTF
jgi:hypothetical protein